MSHKIDLLKTVIATAVPDADIRVSTEDDEHFEALIISERFIGLPLVKQHQLVIVGVIERRQHNQQVRVVVDADSSPAKNRQR